MYIYIVRSREWTRCGGQDGAKKACYTNRAIHVDAGQKCCASTRETRSLRQSDGPVEAVELDWYGMVQVYTIGMLDASLITRLGQLHSISVTSLYQIVHPE